MRLKTTLLWCQAHISVLAPMFDRIAHLMGFCLGQ